MTCMEDISTRWTAARPFVTGLAVDIVVEQQALFCESRARAENADAAKLDWSARSELARKWSTMPGAKTAASDVASECARKLAV